MIRVGKQKAGHKQEKNCIRRASGENLGLGSRGFRSAGFRGSWRRIQEFTSQGVESVVMKGFRLYSCEECWRLEASIRSLCCGVVVYARPP